MKAMILAAGRGERMRPLTDHTPKPLLAVNGQPLIVWHLKRLAAAGITEVVINHAWLGHKIELALGNGKQWGVQIEYSAESPALETGGGIVKALPLLSTTSFLVINGDIWCDWPLETAFEVAATMDGKANRTLDGRSGARAHGAHSSQVNTLAHLVLVNNPAHNASGDFCLNTGGLLQSEGVPKLTFSGIGIYRPELFQTLPLNESAPLAPLLRQAITQTAVRGEHYQGAWIDVGTPDRLLELSQWLKNH